MKKLYKKIKYSYDLGNRLLNDSYHKEGAEKSILEISKTPLRYEIINYILRYVDKETKYLEIGVRYPEANFDKIISEYKFSVDPGIENIKNPVDFKLTSDEFFNQLRRSEILNKNIKFDVIFIDGLHLAEQVERDIDNSLEFLDENGFIVLHDCNPPTVFHASETFLYRMSPSKGYWNGTTWKAFFKFRQRSDFFSCCIDSDWGVGIISKNNNLGLPTNTQNPYFEYNILDKNRKECLNLISFEELKIKLQK
jgi:hypothetical protein